VRGEFQARKSCSLKPRLFTSQGELSFCGAIEMAGIITFSTSIIKGGVEKFALKQPIFLPSPIDPVYSSKVSLPCPSLVNPRSMSVAYL
jgi:acetamidase/formamidase